MSPSDNFVQSQPPSVSTWLGETGVTLVATSKAYFYLRSFDAKKKKKCSQVTHFSDHLLETTVGTSVLMSTCVWVCEWPESTQS